jgi:hypothetical protein
MWVAASPIIAELERLREQCLGGFDAADALLAEDQPPAPGQQLLHARVR